MKQFAIGLSVILALVSLEASAAVPAAITTMFSTLTTDAGTVFGAVVTLCVAAFAGLWLLSYAKKGARKAS